MVSKKLIGKLTINECQAEITENEGKRSEILDQIKPLEKKAHRFYYRNKKLRDRIATIKSEQKKIDWEWVLSCEWNDGSVRLKYREKVLRDIGLDSSGYFDTINQTCIRITLHKNDSHSVAKNLQGLKKIFPYLKPVEDGFVIVDIFEHTLSECGVYRLWIDKENKKYQITKTTYGHRKVLKEFNDLKKALEYIQEHHYYESR